mgnify:CR=1 FL=1
MVTMTTQLLDMPATAARSEKLIAASERGTHDPFQEVDWEIALDNSAYYLPPEMLALFGTDTWDAMSEDDRITYSRH